MRRELPAKPNLEHLKSQAKDLLDAHRRCEPEAFARIRAAVPAFAHKSDEDIARGPFALHDAQSAIAREYGCVSWAELRTRVAAANDAGHAVADPEAAVHALGGPNVPPELEARIREVLALGRIATDASTPPSVPVLPVRNAVVFPGTMIPLDINRPGSMRALEAAVQTEPGFLAVFAQRAFDTERPTHEDLHPTGCLCAVRILHRRDDASSPGGGNPVGPAPAFAWTLVEGIRWVKLEALDQVDPYYLARVVDAGIDQGDEPQIAALDRRLRELAHRFADTMAKGRDQVHAVIDRTTEARQLADLVVSNFPIPVAEMAAYAEEIELSRKLDRAIALLGAELAKLQPGSSER